MNAVTPPDPHAARVARLYGDHRAIRAQIADLDDLLAAHRIAAALRAGHLGDALDLMERDREARIARDAATCRAALRAGFAALRPDPHDAAAPQSRPGFLPCPAHIGAAR